MPFHSYGKGTVRNCTGSTILYYYMMDVWTVFENMQCFWTWMETVSSLCYLPQTSHMLLLESLLLPWEQRLNCLISVQRNASYLSQNGEWCIVSPWFLHSWQWNSVPVFLPCMSCFPKHWSLLVEQKYCVFFLCISLSNSLLLLNHLNFRTYNIC